jgi:hypothetical protein
VVILGQKRGEKELDLLRLISSRAEALMKDIKRWITEDDPDFSLVVIRALFDLIELDVHLFISSLSDSLLLDIVGFFLCYPGTYRIVLTILMASSDSAFLSTVSYPICDYIVSHPADNYAHRMIVPLAHYPLKIMELIGLIPEYPSLLSSLLCVLKQILVFVGLVRQRFFSVRIWNRLFCLLQLRNWVGAVLRVAARFDLFCLNPVPVFAESKMKYLAVVKISVRFVFRLLLKFSALVVLPAAFLLKRLHLKRGLSFIASNHVSFLTVLPCPASGCRG